MTVSLRFAGRLESLPPADRRALLDRATNTGEATRRQARSIVESVAQDGDRAVRRFTKDFDGVDLTEFAVPQDRLDAAAARIPQSIAEALHRSARNVASFHRACLPRPVEWETEPGVRLRRVPHPVQRVAVYAPGGRAAYPSSVIMGVVPARIAGCRSVVVASPPGPDGVPPDSILAAAAIAGADRVYSIGGAQAIGALAYGTESIEPVDRIVGPGNAFVTEAKLAVAHRVGIDSPAGPSELLVIADRTSSLECVAAEMVAQAEHDPDAVVVAVLVGESRLAMELSECLARRIATAPRNEIVRAALSGQGAVLWTDSAGAAVGFANEFAAEHLLVVAADAEALAAGIGTAGTVFIGPTSSVVFGDYLSGANHVLPTAGLARAFSGLGTESFIRWVTEQRIDHGAATRLSRATAVLATIEGLPGHRAAAELWSTGEGT